MDSVEQFISTFGYLAVFVGVFVEGEAIVITAGFLAARGLLDLHGVMAAAFLGSLCTYQLFFGLGRTQGMRFLARMPRWEPRIRIIQARLHRYHLWIVLGYRLFFGLRTVTPFVLGMSTLTQWRFLLLDLTPALIWAVTFSYLGFHFGTALERVFTDLDEYQLWLALAVVLIGLLVVLLYIRASQRQKA